jgi:eukaryotic-like serine/threonine-protein kinase
MAEEELPAAPKSDRPSKRPGGAASLIGTVISGRYRIDSILGEGGMGIVYAGEHALMRKRVAIKVLHPEMSRIPDMVARFEREAMAAGHIDHPNIAAATDFGQLPDGSFFLALEFVEGENLREVISRGRMPVARALHIGEQIVSALSRAHSLGVVHRDLKPDNVMLVVKGSDHDFVKILDFGIAKVPIHELGAAPPPSAAEPTPPTTVPPKVLTQIGMIYGTPEYMAPEQALGQPVDGRADLYAVGVLLFEMLTGRRPYEHANMAMLLGQHVAAPIPAMVDKAPDVAIPSAIEAVVRRLLAKDAAQRFQTADELAEALQQAQFVTLPTEPPVSMASMRLAVDTSGIPRQESAPALAGLPLGLRDPATLRWVGIGGGVLLVVILGLVVALSGSHPTVGSTVGDGSAQTPSPTGSGSETSPAGSASAEPAEDPLARPLLNAELALAKKGGAAQAIGILLPLAATYPDRPKVHRLLERAYMADKSYAAAVGEADTWLKLEPSASADQGLQGDLGVLATLVANDPKVSPKVSEEAISLLAARMGDPGVNILYDLSYAGRGRTPWPSELTRRTKAQLAEPQVRAHAGPQASVLLALRDSSSCQQTYALLPRAKADADSRALAILEPLSQGSVFSPKTACFHLDHELSETIAAIRARASKK